MTSGIRNDDKRATNFQASSWRKKLYLLSDFVSISDIWTLVVERLITKHCMVNENFHLKLIVNVFFICINNNFVFFFYYKYVSSKNCII